MPDVTDYRAVNRRLKSEVDFKMVGMHMQTVRKKRGMTQSMVAEKMKLGTKYYASIEAGTVQISFQRFLQFIVIMQTSADYLLAGSHPDYPSQFNCIDTVCKERVSLNNLLDQCSDDLIKVIYIITEGLVKAKNEQ